MNRVVDFTQGPLQADSNPYHVAIQGNAFFQIREADGSTTYTRDGAFQLSPTGEVKTSDGATVLGKGGSPLKIDVSKSGTMTIGSDGEVSINGEPKSSIGFSHFANPSAALHPGAYGRFIATNSSDAKTGLDKNDHVFQGNLEGSNANPVIQMSNMIQAARMYEANSKSIKAVDDSQNQLITTLGGHP